MAALDIQEGQKYTFVKRSRVIDTDEIKGIVDEIYPGAIYVIRPENAPDTLVVIRDADISRAIHHRVDGTTKLINRAIGGRRRRSRRSRRSHRRRSHRRRV
jgi:hypothetical protein